MFIWVKVWGTRLKPSETDDIHYNNLFFPSFQLDCVFVKSQLVFVGSSHYMLSGIHCYFVQPLHLLVEALFYPHDCEVHKTV